MQDAKVIKLQVGTGTTHTLILTVQLSILFMPYPDEPPVHKVRIREGRITSRVTPCDVKIAESGILIDEGTTSQIEGYRSK